MSLLGFQRVLSAFAASPDLVRAVRAEGEAALAEFDLTPVELRRAVAAAKQAGMVINCGLHRTNRINSILEMLPLTIFVIGNEVRRMADLFWTDYPNPDFTTRRELHRFAGWLRERIADGTFPSPYLREVVDYEMHLYDLGMAPRKRLAAEAAEADARWPDGPLVLHPLTRLARFRHDSAALLKRLRERAPLPYADLAEEEHYLLLDRRGEGRTLPLEVEYGRALAALEDGAAEVDAERLAEMHAAGFLVHAAPASVAHAAESALATVA